MEFSSPAVAGAKLYADPVPDEPSGQPGGSCYGAPLSGLSIPFGAHFNRDLDAHNFALFSSTATAVSLVFFNHDSITAGHVVTEVPLDPLTNRTGNVWHIALPHLHDGLLYGYRVDGANQDDPSAVNAAGLRHDPSRVLLDPYATAVVSRARWGQLGPALDYEDPGVLGMCDTWPQAASPVPSRHSEPFDWQGDRPLQLPMHSLVVYEAHVRGFTAHPSSRAPPGAAGTFAAMASRLDYLADLGVTALELLPVFEFNELEYYNRIPGTDLFRYNFWGYSTVAFFAPMSRFAEAGRPGAAADELKLLVREAHRRGIEVLLDVVFNHTAEGNELGPHISFRGLDNRTYYMLAPEGQYYNYSGCGNTFNCNDPVARFFILDCLRFWVQEYHIDGFRFDLASILTRAPAAWHPADWAPSASDSENPYAGASPAGAATAGGPAAIHSNGAILCDAGYMSDGAGTATGTPLAEPPVVELISEDPVLRGTKLIAEAWDCDGLNQVGAFPHYDGRWAEWNGHFRDTVRQFIKGSEGDFIGAFASALMGSPELYGKAETHEGDWWGRHGGARWRGGRTPGHTVNFVTAHDGFTLADLVSYNEKHNEANGEDNKDGETHNLSWNCGAEGPTDKAAVLDLRQRQMRNHAAALLLAQGVPMILMGDEYGHGKEGNNNTYCHDSPWNWLDWDAAAGAGMALRRFWRALIRFRRARPELGQAHYLSGEVRWHGSGRDSTPEWDSGRFLALTIEGPSGHAIYAAFNTMHTACIAELPERVGRTWRLFADTGKPAPYDVMVVDDALSHGDAANAAAAAAAWTRSGTYAMLPWSCLICESVGEGEEEAVGGLDRWDALAAELPPDAPYGSTDDGDGGRVATGAHTELAFGTALKAAGLLGDRPPPPQAFGGSGSDGSAPTPRRASMVAAAGGEAPRGAGGGEKGEEEELRELARELLGAGADLALMAPREREEMLAVLRENLALRKRLRGEA